jgi:hypothetical protein
MISKKEQSTHVSSIDIKNEEVLVASDKFRLQIIQRDIPPLLFSYLELSDVLFKSCPVRPVCYIIGYLDLFLPLAIPPTKDQLNKTTGCLETKLVKFDDEYVYRDFNSDKVFRYARKVYIINKRIFVNE